MRLRNSCEIPKLHDEHGREKLNLRYSMMVHNSPQGGELEQASGTTKPVVLGKKPLCLEYVRNIVGIMGTSCEGNHFPLL
jgi:hypothetical protein